MRRDDLVAYLDSLLGIAEIPDYPNAHNGLQLEGRPEIERLCVAVDGSVAISQDAVEKGADLLLLHHGLLWDAGQPLVGPRYRRFAPLIRAEVNVYAAHLPLDVHPLVGNNAVLIRRLGLEVEGTFGDFHGVALGSWAPVPKGIALHELAGRVAEILGYPIKNVVAGGLEDCRRVGVLTGAGGGAWRDAVAAGLDTLITGEGRHSEALEAEDAGLNVIYAGHYATETVGVKALAEHLADHFGLAWQFLEHGTGM